MTRHSSKNKYVNPSDAQKAAAKYERMHGFVHRWYKCDECEYWHLATKTHNGQAIVSLDAIRWNRKHGHTTERRDS